MEDRAKSQLAVGYAAKARKLGGTQSRVPVSHSGWEGSQVEGSFTAVSHSVWEGSQVEGSITAV